VKILTSCPSCLQGLTRYQDDLPSGLLEADYIVIEMARKILGRELAARLRGQTANAGGIERVLVDSHFPAPVWASVQRERDSAQEAMLRERLPALDAALHELLERSLPSGG
jgi:hypothetical protein